MAGYHFTFNGYTLSSVQFAPTLLVLQTAALGSLSGAHRGYLDLELLRMESGWRVQLS